MKPSRTDLECQVQAFRTRALEEHDEMRRSQNRALAAEQRLAEFQPKQDTEWDETR